MRLELDEEARDEIADAAVYYEVIYVVAMAHASRPPGYWLARLRKLTR